MITDQYVNGQYLEHVPDWHVADSPWKAQQVYRMIAKHDLPVRTVCDIGCGAGRVLEELQARMPPEVEFTGCDISPQAVDLARSRENGRLKFIQGDFLQMPGLAPDLALLLDVFEHVPDYLGFLEALRAKSDWIIFHIPLDICAKAVLRKSWWMLRMRQRYGHLHYFTKETALATLSDAGFEVVDWFYTDDCTISDDMIPEWIRPRLWYELRRVLARVNPDLAASFFDSFNLMVLARGDRSRRR